MTVSRRSFVAGLAAPLGYLKVGPEVDMQAQAPAAQYVPSAHVLPHLPQFCGSFCRFTQWSPQQSRASVHSGVHFPASVGLVPVELSHAETITIASKESAFLNMRFPSPSGPRGRCFA